MVTELRPQVTKEILENGVIFLMPYSVIIKGADPRPLVSPFASGGNPCLAGKAAVLNHSRGHHPCGYTINNVPYNCAKLHAIPL